MKRFFHKLLRTSLRVTGTLLFLVLAMEALFRGGCFDPYGTEWRFLNQRPSPTNPEKKVLVMGDSFTASPQNYVEELQKKLPRWQFFNAAVPGTGVFQANVIAQRRFEEAKPDIFIYQIYLGNDLFDLRYPINWQTTGTTRNLYWSAANHLRSLNWLNYKLGQWRAKEAIDAKQLETSFSPATYSAREKMMFRAEPNLIEAQSHLLDERKSDMEDYLEELEELLSHCEVGNCQTILLLIPHCAETRPVYRERMGQLGAVFSMPPASEKPFVKMIREFTDRREGVKVLDLEIALRGSSREKEAYYYENDPHLNAAGHKLLADLLAAILE